MKCIINWSNDYYFNGYDPDRFFEGYWEFGYKIEDANVLSLKFARYIIKKHRQLTKNSIKVYKIRILQ